MKLILSLFTLLILAKECKTNKDSLSSITSSNNIEKMATMENITLVYNANSRGFFEEIVITIDSITIYTNRNKTNPIKIACSTEDWNSCMTLLETIEVKKLPSLEAPTKMRHYDGAAHATLTIKNKEESYQTSTFDHGLPPQEIKAIVDRILLFKKDKIKH
jgi:hypothetical protein